MTTFDEILAAARHARPADARIAYGDHALAYGDLWLPRTGATHVPIVVFIHGGCWLAQYGVDHVAAVAAALADEGYAAWTPEYRRLGDVGGGWPGSFDDVGNAIDFVRILTEKHPVIDGSRVIVAGHSAGGQLALWSGSRTRSKLDALRPAAVMSLAGISDLATYSAQPGNCNKSVVPLLGGQPTEIPDRYRAVSPIERLPLGIPTALVHGTDDPTVPVAMSEAYAARARAEGDTVDLVVVRDAAHFDVVAPGTTAWDAVVKTLRRLVLPT